MKKVDPAWFQQADTLMLAQALLGMVLESEVEGQRCRGRIVETEAYLGVTDRASHAWKGRRTARTEIMYLPGGHAYVYLCYGIHHLFNIVTHAAEVPHAILIRGLEPLEGIETMLARRNMRQLKPALTAGPGALSQAMGIRTTHSGLLLSGPEICLRDDSTRISPDQILASPRVGVAYAGADALLPYRFRVRGSRWSSPAP